MALPPSGGCAGHRSAPKCVVESSGLCGTSASRREDARTTDRLEKGTRVRERDRPARGRILWDRRFDPLRQRLDGDDRADRRIAHDEWYLSKERARRALPWLPTFGSPIRTDA